MSQFLTRRLLLDMLIDKYSYTSYLELGCGDGYTFDYIDLSDKTGVDIKQSGSIRSTTCDFFDRCRKKYDLIFIDADHRFEAVEKDLHNSLEHLNDGGCIVIHDCLPKEEYQQDPQRLAGCNMWLGEGWKVVAQARQRDDLDIVVVDADCGMAVIFKQPNTDIVTELPELTWENYLKYRDKLLRIVKPYQLIDFLPPPVCRNIWISTVQEWGRIGHQFNDIIAGPLIAELFGFRYYYSGFVNQENLNYFLNFADMFDQFEQNDAIPLCEISTSVNYENKWDGLSFPVLRKMMRSIPPNTNVVLRRSTFFNLHNLYKYEQQFLTLPGLFNKQIKRWRLLVKETNLFKEVTSDFVPKPGVLNVATYVRGGGSLHDNAGRTISKDAYDHVVRQIQADHPDHELNVVYYSQGPHNDLVGFSNENIMICDNTYPRMCEVIRTFLSADIFIAGHSSFSTMISMLRDGPNYFLRNNPWILPKFSRVVDG